MEISAVTSSRLSSEATLEKSVLFHTTAARCPHLKSAGSIPWVSSPVCGASVALGSLHLRRTAVLWKCSPGTTPRALQRDSLLFSISGGAGMFEATSSERQIKNTSYWNDF